VRMVNASDGGGRQTAIVAAS
nr:hypothetical protein [Tanacetum cinerariifolium]